MTKVQAQALAKALRTIRKIASKALTENNLPRPRGRGDRFSASKGNSYAIWLEKA